MSTRITVSLLLVLAMVCAGVVLWVQRAPPT